MKVVKVIIPILIIIGLGVFSFLKYKECNELTVELVESSKTITSLRDDINTLRTDLENAKAEIPVYCIGDQGVRAGSSLKLSMLDRVNVNGANYIDSYITEDNIEEFLGLRFKTNVNAGDVLFKEMFRPKSKYEEQIYKIDIKPPFLPVGLREGDYIDIEILIPADRSIHTFKVMTHRVVEKITGAVVTLNVSYAETILMKQVYADCAAYNGVRNRSGVQWQIVKYVEDDETQVSFYPVSNSMETLIDVDINVKDKSRLINKNLRKYVDYLLTLNNYNKIDQEENSSVNQYFNAIGAEIQGAYEDDLQQELGNTEETAAKEQSDEGTSGLFDMGG